MLVHDGPSKRHAKPDLPPGGRTCKVSHHADVSALHAGTTIAWTVT
jgi:hypothetical protein